MFARLHILLYPFLIDIIGGVLIGSNAIAGTAQIAVHAIPPPGKSDGVFQYENRLCTQNANGAVELYAQCMRQRGNKVEAFGPGGVAVNIPPPNRPMPSPPAPQLQQVPVTKQSQNNSAPMTNANAQDSSRSCPSGRNFQMLDDDTRHACALARLTCTLDKNHMLGVASHHWTREEADRRLNLCIDRLMTGPPAPTRKSAKGNTSK